MDPSAVAKQFTDFYYHTFDTNRNNLAPLYVRPPKEKNVIRVDLTTLQRPTSMLTFEQAQILGGPNIVEKLTVTIRSIRFSISGDHSAVLAVH